MKLYYAPGASSLAPHIALRAAGQRFDLDRVDRMTNQTASGRDFALINPKGSVPCLELEDHDTLTEAQVILQYIGDLAPDHHLVPRAGAHAHYHLQDWLGFLATEVHAPFAPLLAARTPHVTASIQRGTIGDRLTYVHGVLEDRVFLMGGTFTVADAYLFTLLQWCERFAIDLAMWPRLDDYEERIAHRPEVLAAMSAEGVPGRRRLQRSA